MSAKISVIIPVYNVEKYLAQCLDSVISQDLENIEIICVNDGSPDRSAEILEAYAQKDDRIHVITQENRGLSAARNAGSAQAAGKYLYFLDSDDYLLPGALQTMYDFAEENELQVLRAEQDFLFEDEDSESTKRRRKFLHDINGHYPDRMDGVSLYREFLKNGDSEAYISMWLFRREYVESLALRFHEGALYEDNAYVFAALAAAERTRVCYIKAYVYRIRSNSIVGEEKITFSKCYGWYMAYQDMMRTSEQYGLTEDSMIMEDVYRKLANARYNITLPPQEEREKYKLVFSEAEQVVFRGLVMDPALYKEKNNRLTRDIKQIKEKNDALTKELKQLKEKSDALTKDANQLKRKNNNLTAELNQIKGSRAYRLSCLMRVPVIWLRKLLGIEKK